MDLRALEEDVAAAFEGAERGIEVKLQVPDTAELYGNALLLRQAVDNVVRNALRYSAAMNFSGNSPISATSLATSVVHIALTAVADGYCLMVRDQGPGVPDTMLEDIFKPFFRVNADRDRASGGTGMGLCLVEQAVRLHSGTVLAFGFSGIAHAATTKSMPAANSTSNMSTPAKKAVAPAKQQAAPAKGTQAMPEKTMPEKTMKK